jgi:hypothetical protein
MQVYARSTHPYGHNLALLRSPGFEECAITPAQKLGMSPKSTCSRTAKAELPN